MIEINIDPTMLRLGTLALSWHGFFTAVGLFLGVWIAGRLAPSVGIKTDDVYNATPWVVVGGVIGARLFHVADQWPLYAQNPVSILLINEGGIAIYGGLIGGAIAGVVYCWKNRISVPLLADAAAVGMIAGQGVGRIGDIINGEHLGKPLDAPWSVVYTNPETGGQIGAPVHLAVGYEMILDLAVFALLLRLWKKLPAGVLFWIYWVLYSAIRIGVGFYRIDTPVAFGLGQAQLIGIAGIILGIPMAYLQYRRGMAATDDTSDVPPDDTAADEPAGEVLPAR